MSTLDKILGQLPGYNERFELVKQNQQTSDIISLINKMHYENRKNYDAICEHFWKGNVEDTARGLFDFLKEHVEYDIEPEDTQTVKTPSAILHSGHGDCKHYASFIVGVVDALRRKGYPVLGAYMYINNEDKSNNYHHVFGVVKDTRNGKEYFTDPIYNVFNKRKKYLASKVVPMALYKVSGDIGANRVEEAVQKIMRERGVSKEEAIKIFFQIDKQAAQTPGARLPAPKKATKAQKKEAKAANKQARKDNRAARRQKRKELNALPKAERKAAKKAYRQEKRKDRKEVREMAKGGQKVAHVALKVPNAVSRNAFLLLVKLNVFHMASKMAAKYHSDPGWQRELKTAWYAAGGDWKNLKQAINQGINVWNKRTADNKISQISGPGEYIPPYEKYWYPTQQWQLPMCNCDNLEQIEDKGESIGYAVEGGGVVAAAAIAAAVPIIIKLLSLLKRSGVDTDEIQESANDSEDEILAEYEDAENYPVEDDEVYTDSGAPQFGIKTYTKEDGTPGIQYTKSNLNDNGDVSYSSGFTDLDQVWDRAKGWVIDNQRPIMYAGGAVLLLAAAPKIISAFKGSKKRR